MPWTREDYDEADEIWRRALALAEEHDDTWARVRALTALSINFSQQNNTEEAARLIDQARELADEMGDRFSVAVTMVQRGRLDEDLGNFEEAIPQFDRAIEIFKELGARWEVADALAERGISYRDLGRLDEGEEDLRNAIRISGELGEQQIAGWSGRALDRLAQIRARERRRARHGRLIRAADDQSKEAWPRVVLRALGRPIAGSSSVGCSTSATTRADMKRPVRTALPPRVTSETSTTPRPVDTSTRRPARVASISIGLDAVPDVHHDLDPVAPHADMIGRTVIELLGVELGRGAAPGLDEGSITVFTTRAAT